MTPPSLWTLVKDAVIIAAILVAIRQVRKPQGWPGRFFLWAMRLSHAGVTRWGLSRVPIGTGFTILDVGCGSGATIRGLATTAVEGKVYGIDYSAASVAASRRTNADSIRAGRVDIQQASVSHLPFAEATFDLVTAVETHYYWPRPVDDFREVLRVLKPGGRLLVIAEQYKGRRFSTAYIPVMKLIGASYLTIDEHRELLATSGFANVDIVVEPSKGWICCVGVKPAR